MSEVARLIGTSKMDNSTCAIIDSSTNHQRLSMGLTARVLHICAGKLFGGIESVCITLAKSRRQCADLDQHFAYCFEGRLSRELTETGAPLHPLGAARVSRPWTVWTARCRLEKVLEEVKPDAVLCHACWPHSLFAPVVRAAGLPLVFWARDLHSGRHWLERWGSLTPPDYVLANSRFTLQSVDTIFPRVQSEVVHPPVSPPAGLSTFKESHRNQIRAELGTAADAVVIIQSCRLERWKGHQLLLDALAVLAELPNWVCWIAGGGQRPHEDEYFRELKQKASLSGIGDRVHFLGQRQDVTRLLSAADIHCQPNTAPEPFGVAFVEALYAGLPVVTTQFGGALEILDEGCSIMVPPGDKTALAKGLQQLIIDASMRKRLGAAGPARAAMLCEPKSQLEKLCKVVAGLSRKAAK